MKSEAKAEVVGKAEVEEGLEEDLEIEMVAEIVNQRPKKILEIMGLKPEEEIRTKAEEEVTGGHMIKEKYSVITIANMRIILMNVGMRIHQIMGRKERKQI